MSTLSKLTINKNGCLIINEPNQVFYSLWPNILMYKNTIFTKAHYINAFTKHLFKKFKGSFTLSSSSRRHFIIHSSWIERQNNGSYSDTALVVVNFKEVTTIQWSFQILLHWFRLIPSYLQEKVLKENKTLEFQNPRMRKPVSRVKVLQTIITCCSLLIAKQAHDTENCKMNTTKRMNMY